MGTDIISLMILLTAGLNYYWPNDASFEDLEDEHGSLN